MTAHPIASPPRPDRLVLRFALVGVVAVVVGLLSTLALAAANPRLFVPGDGPTAMSVVVAMRDADSSLHLRRDEP